MNKTLLKELKMRVNLEVALYKSFGDQKTAPFWWMSPFTHEQFIANQKRIQEIVSELEKENE